MPTVISVRAVSRSFGKRTVLRDVSLTVEAGQIVGLLGSSGAGKTTLVRLIAGIDRADAGTVVVDGTPMPARAVLARVGYMAQSTALYRELSGWQNLAFFGGLFRIGRARLAARIESCAQLVGLASDLGRPVAQYSSGMQRRLSLAVALLHEPRVLLLDEPTVGIDPVLRRSVWAQLRRCAAAGVGIVLTTHAMDEAERCDAICLLREGAVLVAGAPDRIRAETGARTLEDAVVRLCGAP